MITRASGTYLEVIVRFALTLTALFTAGSVLAEALPPPAPPPPNLRVAAANSSTDNSVYDVFFSPASTLLLNSDGAVFNSFGSLVYVPDTASPAGLDLVVADTGGANIVRYVGPTGTPLLASTVVWNATSGGPQHPDGLSVDTTTGNPTSGNLYVVTTNGGAPQVWVFRPAASPSGYSTNPILLDGNVAGFPGFHGKEVDSLVESIVAPQFQNISQPAGIGAGDLLVLASDNDNDGNSDENEPGLVYQYKVADIQAAINCAATINPGPGIPVTACTMAQLQPAASSPTILLSNSQFYSPSSGVPHGMDFWPLDGSLLISTSVGTIVQYPLPTGGAVGNNFASPTCNTEVCPTSSFYKLRTGMQTQAGITTTYAFVTQSTGTSSGNILEFGSPIPYGGFTYPMDGSTPPADVTVVPTNASAPSAPPTAGSPKGLAVAPPGSALVAPLVNCTTSGCAPANATGGLTSTIQGPGAVNVSGEILQQACVLTDTRVRSDGTCPGTLTITNSQCPNFSPHTSYTLLPTICGASASTSHPVPAGWVHGNQLAAIQTVASGVDGIADIIVDSAPKPSALIPGASDPACLKIPPVGGPPIPEQVVGHAPGQGNEFQPEGIYTVTDVTGYCDGGHGRTGNLSLYVVGTSLTPAITKSIPALVVYTDAKLLFLGIVVHSASIAAALQKQIGACLAQATVLLDTGKFGPAAIQITTCYNLVNHAPQSSFTSSSKYPNPLGDVLSRIQTVYYLMNTLISGNPTIAPIAPLGGD